MALALIVAAVWPGCHRTAPSYTQSRGDLSPVGIPKTGYARDAQSNAATVPGDVVARQETSGKDTASPPEAASEPVCEVKGEETVEPAPDLGTEPSEPKPPPAIARFSDGFLYLKTADDEPKRENRDNLVYLDGELKGADLTGLALPDAARLLAAHPDAVTSLTCAGCTVSTEFLDTLASLKGPSILLALPDCKLQAGKELSVPDALAGRVQALSLRGCDIGNADVRSVAKLPNLRFLDLSGTKVTSSFRPVFRPFNDDYYVPGQYSMSSRQRTRLAAKTKEDFVHGLFSDAGVAFPPRRMLLRVFKKESIIEVWAASGANDPLKLLATYTICDQSGRAGPKKAQGDGQVPEGFYTLDYFNSHSNFFLSMRIDYPNRYDKHHGRTGSAIMIHGSCVSIGCLAMTDERIMELWLMTRAMNRRDRTVHVHLFPQKDMAALIGVEEDNELKRFWFNLKQGFDLFERTHRIPRVSLDTRTGTYRIRPAREAPVPAESDLSHLDEFWKELAAAYPRLAVLDLSCTRIYDSAIDTLSRNQSLSVLTLAGSFATPDGIALLDTSLPDCKVLSLEEPRCPGNSLP